MKAELVPDNGDPPIPITRDVTVVGRRGFCDVVIDDPSLSKRHCVLVKTDGLLVVRDLASTNGTKVKGQRIRWAALLPDDRLTLGGYKVRVYLGPDSAPGPSELAERAVSSRRGAGVGVGGSGDEPGGRRATDFAPPSPVETPAFQPSEAWEDEEDDGDATWQKRLSDDIIVELE
jgi:pSer/pThr/pTyr-binding forkhead associated (FHA) protein